MSTHLAPLISDLALILILAAGITLIFKWLKQPVVLGYIVAGFLASNHFDLLPSISDASDINIWAEIGIIFLLFGLGLEFSFKKLMNVGGSALITALVIVTGMMICGFSTGRLLGWDTTDSVFLGGMLSMSSTTIIIKAFNDLGLQKRKFTGLVFGVLIVEDLFAVVLMVLLSSLYLGKNSEALSAGESIFKLIFFLLVWFGAGIYLIPTALARARRYLSRETLLIVALGLCLGMVVLANYAGFSSALGAFIMGSILAETIEAKAITQVTQSVRDLFGAVFFVSVGMLVDPTILAEYWLPVLIITLIVIVGQIAFAAAGMLISGQSLRHAIQSGFSLAQIGEFAFIIATLGLSLGVTSTFLYPIAVAVSVITTFTTPFMIRLSDPAIRFLDRHLPQRVKLVLEQYGAGTSTANTHGAWRTLLTSYVQRTLILCVLLGGMVWLSIQYIVPFCMETVGPEWGRLVSATAVLMVMAPLIWALAVRRIQSKIFIRLWTDSHFNRGFLISLILLRIFLAGIFVMAVLVHIYAFRKGALIGVGLLTLILLVFSRRIQRGWSHFESQFVRNLSANAHGSIVRVNSEAKNLHMTRLTVSPESPVTGKTIGDARLRDTYGMTVISIRRGTHNILIPDASEVLFPGDEMTVVGPEESLRDATARIETPADAIYPQESEMEIRQFWLQERSPLVGLTISESGIRKELQCLVISIERADGNVLDPSAGLQFMAGDVVWFAGEKSRIRQLMAQYQ